MISHSTRLHELPPYLDGNDIGLGIGIDYHYIKFNDKERTMVVGYRKALDIVWDKIDPKWLDSDRGTLTPEGASVLGEGVTSSCKKLGLLTAPGQSTFISVYAPYRVGVELHVPLPDPDTQLGKIVDTYIHSILAPLCDEALGNTSAESAWARLF